MAQETTEVIRQSREPVAGGAVEARVTGRFDGRAQVPSTRSSASRHSTQSWRACSTANCFWLRKPSNGRCSTRAPAVCAIATVASVEYESTTTISSQNASEARQSPMRSASLNAIMQAEIGTRWFEEALMADYLLFATERYALPILQPLADALQAAGHGVHAWFVDGAAGARLPCRCG